MGFGDLFKATKNKALSERVAELEAILTPEMCDLIQIKEQLATANAELAQAQENSKKIIADAELEARNIKEKVELELSEIRENIAHDRAELQSVRAELIETNEEALLQSFGLYQPMYDFATSEEYKDELDAVRLKQKDMLKCKTAATGSATWTVNGKASEGRKMVADMQKLLLRAFNSECDEVVSKVKFNNFDSAQKRICASAEAISKLGRAMSVAISDQYVSLKQQELRLAYEYQVKKQEEKERAKEERARLREEAKLQKEIEAERKKLAKEQTHYQNAYKSIIEQLTTASADEIADLQQKRAEIESHLSDIGTAINNVDYREANQKAGYVYIISNIGAFGDNIYKIGMTRRLDPMERVDELGDASVPFDFDVHALIFSDDAPQLEAALHKAFADKKVNFVNQRREFFHVSLDEIKAVVRENYDKTVEFVDVAPAEQYRKSLLMQKQVVSAGEAH